MQSRIDSFVDYARSMIGAKWRHRGRKPWAVDCIGLVVLSLQHIGYTHKDRLNYSRYPHKDGLRAELKAHFGEPHKTDDMRHGDIALMVWKKGEDPSHVGIISERDGVLFLIHSYSMISVTEHRLDENWKKKIVEVYRIE